VPISNNLFQTNNCLVLKFEFLAEILGKMHSFVIICPSRNIYKVACVHTSGEIDNFSTHCSALIAVAAGQI